MTTTLIFVFLALVLLEVSDPRITRQSRPRRPAPVKAGLRTRSEGPHRKDV